MRDRPAARPPLPPLRPPGPRQTAAGVALLLAALATLADPPTLEHLHPAGGAPGTTNVVSLTGKLDPWPPNFWSDPPGLHLTAQTNKGKLEILIPPNTPAGPRLIRAFNADGASEPRLFVVGDHPETAESEPNNRFDRPQPVATPPTVINGRLDRAGDVDSFSISLRKDEWLVATLQAYVLFSKMDGVLRLVTTNGLQLAWNHDFRTLDPRLVWQAPADMTVVVQVFGFPFPANADVRLAGGDAFVYRLHLETRNHPPALTRLPPAGPPPDTILDLPLSRASVLSQAGDVHRHRFAAKKGEIFEAIVKASAIGSPVDPWLAIEDAAGKELTRADDAPNSPDPRLEWTAPADGEFRLVVGNLLTRGGSNQVYEVALRRLEPDFEVRLTTTSLSLTNGQTNTLKLTVNRLRGHTNPLTLQLHGLPETVRATPLDLPEKGGETTLSFVAADDAPPTNAPFRLSVREAARDLVRSVAADLTTSSVDNGVPGGFTELLIPSTGHLWLTVRPKPAGKPEETPPEKK